MKVRHAPQIKLNKAQALVLDTALSSEASRSVSKRRVVAALLLDPMNVITSVTHWCPLGPPTLLLGTLLTDGCGS